VSRSKEAVYRQSGEAEYDEAGSPPKHNSRQENAKAQGGAEDQAEDASDAVVTPLDTHGAR
jgi:hypothetical protein